MLAPRPSSATCGPGDPGTSFTGLDVDADGIGMATVSDRVQPGTTGVWVTVERPAEYYTSEIVAPL